VPDTHAVAVSTDGYGLRFGLEPFSEPSTRAGRRFARPTKGAEIVGVSPVNGSEIMIVATKNARALLCRVADINFLSGPGKGVTVIKLAKGKDDVLGFVASQGARDLLTVETSRGAEQTISSAKYEVTGRGGKGRELLQRGRFIRMVPRKLLVVSLETD
jgi:DNA gyrase subunit A